MRETTPRSRQARFEGATSIVQVLELARGEQSTAETIEVWVDVTEWPIGRGYGTKPQFQLRMSPKTFEELARDLASVNERVQRAVRDFRVQARQETATVTENVPVIRTGGAP